MYSCGTFELPHVKFTSMEVRICDEIVHNEHWMRIPFMTSLSYL